MEWNFRFGHPESSAVSSKAVCGSLRKGGPTYCLCKTACQVVPFTLFSTETVILFSSASGVKRQASITFPSRLLVTSIVLSPTRLTEAMVLLRPPLKGVSVPSNLAARVCPVGSAKLKVSRCSFKVMTSAFSDRFKLKCITGFKGNKRGASDEQNEPSEPRSLAGGRSGH